MLCSTTQRLGHRTLHSTSLVCAKTVLPRSGFAHKVTSAQKGRGQTLCEIRKRALVGGGPGMAETESAEKKGCSGKKFENDCTTTGGGRAEAEEAGGEQVA